MFVIQIPTVALFHNSSPHFNSFGPNTKCLIIWTEKKHQSELQWGSEYRTCPELEWSNVFCYGRVWFSNVFTFKNRTFKSGFRMDKLTIRKLDKMINVRFLNVSGFRMSNFRIPTVYPFSVTFLTINLLEHGMSFFSFLPSGNLMMMLVFSPASSPR